MFYGNIRGKFVKIEKVINNVFSFDCFTAILMLLLTRECAMNELSQCMWGNLVPRGCVSFQRNVTRSLGCKLYINLIGT